MSELSPLYDIDKSKAKRLLRYLSGAALKQSNQQKRAIKETDERFHHLGHKIGILEQKNVELSNHLLNLTNKLHELERQKSIATERVMRKEREEEELDKEVDELSNDIDDKDSRIRELEEKISEKLARKEPEMPDEPRTSIMDDEERIKELEEKIERRLNRKRYERIDLIKEKLSKAKKIYAAAHRSKNYSEKELEKVKSKIDELESKLEKEIS